MGPAAGGVHLRRPDGPVRVPHLHQGLDLVVAAHLPLAQILHEHPCHLALAYLQPALHSLVDRDKQVLYLLVVDLQHAHQDLVVQGHVFGALHSLEEFFEADRNDAFVVAVAHHRVGLARACFAVGE